MQIFNCSSALGRTFVVPWRIFWRLEIFWYTSAPSKNVSSGVVLHKSSFYALAGLVPKPAIEAGKCMSWLGLLKRACWMEKRPWWGWGSLNSGWSLVEHGGVSLKSHWHLWGVREETLALGLSCWLEQMFTGLDLVVGSHVLIEDKITIRIWFESDLVKS